MSNEMIVLVAFDCILLILLILGLIQLGQGQRWAEQDRKRVPTLHRTPLDGEE